MSSLNWADLVKDASDSAGGSYEPLPDGDYNLKVIEVSATVTSTGKTMFKLTTEVLDGPYAKRRIWDNLVISPENKNALGIFFSKMAALGVPREFFTANNPTNAQIEARIAGASFRAQVGKRVYNGNESNELKKYYVGAPTAQTASVSAPAPVAAPPAPAPAPAPSGAPVVAPPVAAPLSAPSDAPF